MDAIEIIVIISAVLIVLSVVINYFYKKFKHLPTGECSCCKKNNIVKEYHDFYKKNK